MNGQRRRPPPPPDGYRTDLRSFTVSPEGISAFAFRCTRPDRRNVTVVMAVIDEHQDLFEEALASVWAQTVPPAAVVIARDLNHVGAWTTRNFALGLVETDFVAWLDDDDLLDETHLESLLAAQAETGADLVYPCMRVRGLLPDGQPARDPTAVAYTNPADLDEFARPRTRWVNPCGIPFKDEQERHLRYAGNFVPITHLVRTEYVRKVGGFPPSGGKGLEEDYQLLVNLLNAGARFVHTPKVTWTYRITGRNTGGGFKGTGASNRAAFER
jgi:hypothetical protein